MSLDCRNWGPTCRTTRLRKGKSQSCKSVGEARQFGGEADDTRVRAGGRLGV